MVGPAPASKPAGRMPSSTCLRRSTTSTTRSLKVAGAEPGGPDMHFCRPAETASSCQPSTSTSMPPSVAVASTYKSTSWARQAGPTASMGWAMVVEVSPWTRATTLGRCSAIAAMIRSWGKTVPQSVSRVTTSPPARSAISFMRCPKRPKMGTNTLSPASIIEPRHASVAERAVPLTSMAQWFLVLKACR